MHLVSFATFYEEDGSIQGEAQKTIFVVGSVL
jgi:hypothetical protein